MAIVTFLAILKAGGAYVNLALDHPRERFRQIVDQAGARLILCDPGHATMFHGLVDRVITIKDDGLSTQNNCALTANSSGPEHPAEPRTSPGERSQSESDTVQPSNAAIIIHSSGSTGQPKGIVLSHSALSTSVTLIARYLDHVPGTRILQFSSFAFDISLSDFFVTLLSGACLYLPSEHNRLNCLSASMKEMSIDFAYLVPSVAGLLCPEEVPTLRALATGGEPMPPSLVKTWAGKVRLINTYGPAETTITPSETDIDLTQNLDT